MNSTEASTALQAEFNEAEAKLRAAEDKIYKFQAENDMIAVTLEEHQSLVVAEHPRVHAEAQRRDRAREIQLAAKLAQMKKEAAADVLSSPIVMMGDNALVRYASHPVLHGAQPPARAREGPRPEEPASTSRRSRRSTSSTRRCRRRVKILVDGTQDLYDAQVDERSRASRRSSRSTSRRRRRSARRSSSTTISMREQDAASKTSTTSCARGSRRRR